MATLASTNISSFIAADNVQPIAYGQSGLVEEVFRVASGGAAADTVAITTAALRYIVDIRLIQTNVSASDNLSTLASVANTTVTATLVAGTNTFASFLIRVIGRRA